MEAPTIIESLEGIGLIVRKQTKEIGHHITISADENVLDAIKEDLDRYILSSTVHSSVNYEYPSTNSYPFYVFVAGNYFHFKSK